ncbi:hypothetical protein EWB00_000900, partial [Schistosoma japonicum]
MCTVQPGGAVCRGNQQAGTEGAPHPLTGYTHLRRKKKKQARRRRPEPGAACFSEALVLIRKIDDDIPAEPKQSPRCGQVEVKPAISHKYRAGPMFRRAFQGRVSTGGSGLCYVTEDLDKGEAGSAVFPCSPAVKLLFISWSQNVTVAKPGRLIQGLQRPQLCNP